MKPLLEINFNYRTHCQCCHRQGSSSFHVDTQFIPSAPPTKRNFTGKTLGDSDRAYPPPLGNRPAGLLSPRESDLSKTPSISLASTDFHLRASQAPVELSTERGIAELPVAATNCSRDTVENQRAELPETTVENPRRRNSLRKFIAEIMSRSIRPGKHTTRQPDTSSTVPNEMHDDPTTQIEAFVAELEDTSRFVTTHPSHSSNHSDPTIGHPQDQMLSKHQHAGQLPDDAVDDPYKSDNSVRNDIIDDPFGEGGVPALSRRTTLESEDDEEDDAEAHSPVSPMDARFAYADVGYNHEANTVSPIDLDVDFPLLDTAGLTAVNIGDEFDEFDVFDMEIFGPQTTKARAMVDELGYGLLHTGGNGTIPQESRQSLMDPFDEQEQWLKQLCFPQSWSGLMPKGLTRTDPRSPVSHQLPLSCKKESSISQSVRRHFRPLQPKPQAVQQPECPQTFVDSAAGLSSGQNSFSPGTRTGKRKRSPTRTELEPEVLSMSSLNDFAACDDCGEPFKNSEGVTGRIARHKKRSCPKRETFHSAPESTRVRCPVCPQTYARPDGLLAHLREKHFDHPDVSLPAPRRYNVKGIAVPAAR